MRILRLVAATLTAVAIVLAAAPAATAATPPLPVKYRAGANDPVVFITIDDGIVRSQAGLDYVRKHKIPITSFLTSTTVSGQARYFRAISKWGSVQNHTTTHRSLADPSTDLHAQICPVQTAYRKIYGTKPWMLRPPYGAGPTGWSMQSVAASCGITHIVMWDAVVENGRLTTWQGGRLTNGSIILLHYTGNLATDLKVAVSAARSQGLRPANLADYLKPPR